MLVLVCAFRLHACVRDEVVHNVVTDCGCARVAYCTFLRGYVSVLVFAGLRERGLGRRIGASTRNTL